MEETSRRPPRQNPKDILPERGRHRRCHLRAYQNVQFQRDPLQGPHLVMACIHNTLSPRHRGADQAQTRQLRRSRRKVLHGKQQQHVRYHVVSEQVGRDNWYGARD